MAYVSDGSRVCDSNRVALAGIDADVTLTNNTDPVIYCAAIDGASGDRMRTLGAGTFTLHWRRAAGTFAAITDTTEVKIAGTGTVLVNGAAVTSTNARCNKTATFIAGGIETEGVSTSTTTPLIELRDDNSGEWQIALDFSGALPSQAYDFRGVVVHDAGTTNIDYATNITTAAASAAEPVLVQHAAWRANRGFDVTLDTDKGNNFAVILPNPVRAGNCLIVDLSYPFSAGRTIAITDNKGTNTYTIGATADDTTNGFTTRVYYALNVTAGTQSLTITFDTTIYGVIIKVTEFRNVAITAAADGSSTADGSGLDPSVAVSAFVPTTNNTLVYHTALMTNTNTGYGINKCSGFVAGAGWQLLSADREVVTACQYKVHPSGSITPVLTSTISAPAGPGQSWNAVAIALKSAAAGTAPPAGIRIIREIHTAANDGSAAVSNPTLEFPCDGNLAHVSTCFGSGQATLTAISDTDGSSWTVRTVPSLYPQMAYAKNVAPSTSRRITLTLSTGYWMNLCLYDIIGADPIPFDVQVDGTHQQLTAHQSITPLGVLSPSTNFGLVLTSMNNGHGPMGAILTPVGGILDNSHYDNHTDTSATDDSGDGYAHYYNPDTSEITWGWQDDNGINTTANQTNASATITAVPTVWWNWLNGAGAVGYLIFGTGIQANTTIASFGASGTIVMDKTATQTLTGNPLEFVGLTQSVAVVVAYKAATAPVGQSVMSAPNLNWPVFISRKGISD